jgi:hypothetical protein
MITGGVCPYAAGNQLAQAIAFLQTHRVALVTITIGGDNVLRCISKSGKVDDECVDDGVAGLSNDLPQIVSALKVAAGPSVPIVAANYYDPILAAWVLVPPPDGPMLAQDSLVLTQGVNTTLQGIYSGFDIRSEPRCEVFS